MQIPHVTGGGWSGFPTKPTIAAGTRVEARDLKSSRSPTQFCIAARIRRSLDDDDDDVLDRALCRASNPTTTTIMATAFLRNLVLRPALRPTLANPAAPAPIARAFSTTPSQSATLNQVLRVRSPLPPNPSYLHPNPPATF